MLTLSRALGVLFEYEKKNTKNHFVTNCSCLLKSELSYFKNPVVTSCCVLFSVKYYFLFFYLNDNNTGAFLLTRGQSGILN